MGCARITALISVVVLILLLASYLCIHNKELTYVETEDSIDTYKYRHPPRAFNEILLNECKWPILEEKEWMEGESTMSRPRICKTEEEQMIELSSEGRLVVTIPTKNEETSGEDEISCGYKEIYISNAVLTVGATRSIATTLATPVNASQLVAFCEKLGESGRKETVSETTFVNIGVEDEAVESNLEYPSLSILLLKGISLNDFSRILPSTNRFLLDNDFVTMNMYNKISSGSHNVLRDVFFGQSNKDADVWKLMKERGCITMLNDGWNRSPVLRNVSSDVDIDLLPYHTYNHEKLANGEGCLRDGRIINHDLLDIWRDVSISQRSKCHFDLSVISFDSSKTDKHLRNVLDVMKANGAFDNTVMVLMSDEADVENDGGSSSRSPSSLADRIRSRNPLFSIRIPKSDTESYYNKMFNLQTNANRLVTSLDIHETLREIATGPLYPEDSNEAPDGVSLLSSIIPSDITCSNTSIPLSNCLCMEEEVVETDVFSNSSSLYQEAFSLIQSHLLSFDCIRNVTTDWKEYSSLRVFHPNSLIADDTVKTGAHFELGFNIRSKTRSFDYGFAMRAVARLRLTPDNTLSLLHPMVLTYASQKCFAKTVEDFCSSCFESLLPI